MLPAYRTHLSLDKRVDKLNIPIKETREETQRMQLNILACNTDML